MSIGKHFAHISQLHPHPDNVRDDLGDISELAASIAAHGILQPVVVEHHPSKGGHYQIIAGHRRFAAAKRARLEMVPIAFRQSPAGVTEHPEELMLIENCQRRDLNPMDKAEAMGKLRKRGMTAAQIARSIGLTDSTVGYYLSLLDLDVKAQERVRAGGLSAADAVAAVRRTRQRSRAKEGKPAMGGGEWEPDHFTRQHPLARKAQALCDGREHSMRRRVGKLACGECWETVIRADERTVAAALAQAESLRSVS